MVPSHVIRVLVADGHPVYLEGLVRWTAACPGFEVVGAAADGSAALAVLREQQPDVAVVDHELPGIDGPRLTALARRERLVTRFVIVAEKADGRAAFRALGAGAAALLAKDGDLEELRAALTGVAAGRVVLPPAVQSGVAREIRLRRRAGVPALTAREQEILSLVASDRSTARIASDLHLSATTVKGHLQHVYAKLEVSDRAAAVATAMRLGLVE
jgi:two-component system nitrate/nitrite response regulator NarL